jgi:hypothetical protein
MKINKPEKLHNKHNEIYYNRRVLSKNKNILLNMQNGILMELKKCRR